MTEEKQYFVGIRFQGSGKSYYFSTVFDDLKVGDLVVVDTINGNEVAIVCSNPMSMDAYKSNLALKPITRKPTYQDLRNYEMGLEESKHAMEIARKEIENLGLPMNLLEASYTLDGTKVTITYTADNRVDFRELLRNLAPLLHCRIELRQIASRDKAKMIGGIGLCGLPLCCSTFLDQFEGISIGKAKNQMLTLNIPKLSGPCGKLMCCLNFEDDLYTEGKKDFPKIGSIVHLEDGDYTIVGMNILNKQLKLSGNQSIIFKSLEEINQANAQTNKKYERQNDNRQAQQNQQRNDKPQNQNNGQNGNQQRGNNPHFNKHNNRDRNADRRQGRPNDKKGA
ncbi:MAG: stage 0 sporulation protein [Bacilli bacterium]|nr:stage 0 sporulation protein [Bacilli bacterium]